LDELTGIAYDDDSQIAKLTIERGYDKARPRIVVEIEEKLGSLTAIIPPGTSSPLPGLNEVI